MSWFIDPDARAAIHVGGFTVVFDAAGEPAQILVPKLLDLRMLETLKVQGAAEYRRSRGLKGAGQPAALAQPLPTRTDLSLRAAADELVKLLESNRWRALLGRRFRSALADLRYAVSLATEHGVFDSRRWVGSAPPRMVRAASALVEQIAVEADGPYESWSPQVRAAWSEFVEALDEAEATR